MKKTVLIFGISSFVGANLAEILKDEYRVIGTYHHTPVESPGILCVPCDVLKKEMVGYLLSRFRPDFTIYAVGLSSLRDCQLHPRLADSLNTQGAINCSNASERVESKFIFLSSCFVLGGENVAYKEGDSPFPLNVFGQTMSATEFQIQRTNFNYLMFRCSALYGRSFNHVHTNWFEALQSAFAKGEPVHADGSVHSGFLDVDLLGKVLKAVLASDVVNRMFHISSRDSLTRYDFARLYARIFKKDEALIQKISGVFPLDGKKVKDVDPSSLYYQLDVTNLQNFLSIELPTVEESLLHTQKRLGSSGKSSSQTP